MLYDVVARVLSKYGSDLDAILDGEGITVERCRNWHWRFQDVYTYPLIRIPHHISVPEERLRVAHCLGHHFLHGINQVYLRGCQELTIRRQERDADAFAALLLIPADDEDRVRLMTPWEIAEEYEAPQELALLRQKLLPVRKRGGQRCEG